MLPNREMTDDVLQVVVESVFLGRELLEEESCEISDSLILILDALCHLSELALDLDHSVEDEMGEDHKSVLLDLDVGVGETLVETITRGEGEDGKGTRGQLEDQRMSGRLE